MYRSLFLSHGSPMMILQNSPVRQFLRTLGQTMPKPKAVLVQSSHWQSRSLTVGAAVSPELIYDFYGFPDELYRYAYAPNGEPGLAADLAAALTADLDPQRGLDHGIWSVMSQIWPQGDVPVIPLSLPVSANPQSCFELGQSLSTLLPPGIMLIGSGAMTHNLRAYMGQPFDTPVDARVADFTQWMREMSEQGDVESLLRYRQLAPHAAWNHPTDEHFLPLFTSMGIASGLRCLHQSVEYGVIAMDCYGAEPS